MDATSNCPWSKWLVPTSTANPITWRSDTQSLTGLYSIITYKVIVATPKKAKLEDFL